MKAASEASIGLKDRKRKISTDQLDLNVFERSKVPHSASRRHREKINATLEELGSLLPLPDDSRSKLDKLTVLKLSVSFFQTQNYLESGKRRRRVDSAAINEMTKKFEECNISVSDISLEALDSFFIVLTEDGDVFFVSENVSKYLGYTQAFLMHQNFLNFVHQDDVVGFKKCLQKPTKANIIELNDELTHDCQEEAASHRVCFSSIRCHAGRQSSHVSPFYHRSFQFDGNVKPLIRGKMKRHGFFALCTPVNPANPFTSTPKELLQLYSCKMGLDLKISKLDSRGQKCLYLSDKDTVNNTAYLFAHPEDVPVLMMAHTQVNVVGKTETVFRVMNGNGVWQWVRGRARILRNKANQPEFIVADNVLLTDEQGSYYQQLVLETLLEWKANQQSLPSTETKKQHSPENSGSDASSLSSKSSEERRHKGETVPVTDAVVTSNSKKMEHPHVNSQTNEKSENTSCDHPTASPQSCMFTEPPLKKSAVKQLPLDVMAYGDLKPEQTNSGENQVNMVFADGSVDQQINLIKQFLMEVDPKTSDVNLVHENSVVVSHLINYSDRMSGIFTDSGLQQDVNSEVITTLSPSLVQPSLYRRDGSIPGSGVTFGASQLSSTTNAIFPYSVRLGDHETGDEVGTQNIHELPANVTGLTALPNGLGLISTNLPAEGRVDLSSQSGYVPYDSGLYISERQGYCSSDLGQSAVGVCALDSQMRTCRAAKHGLSTPSTFPQFNQDLSICQLENLHPDHLVSSLIPDRLVPLENHENFCNVSSLGTTAHSALVCPEDELHPHLRKSVGQRPPTVATGNFENTEQHYQSGEYSILKMILCEQASR